MCKEDDVLRYLEYTSIYFCYMCGRKTAFPIEIVVPCPNCMVNYRITLCFQCAKKLKEQLESEMKRKEKEMQAVIAYLKEKQKQLK